MSIYNKGDTMKLFISPTSPYARLACVMCLEARLPNLEIAILNPFEDPPELLEHNPSLRVPALVIDEDGTAITESLLIADFAARNAGAEAKLWFQDEAQRQIGGVVMGAIDSAAHIMAGRLVTSGTVRDAAFDSSALAARRMRAVNRSLDRLELLLAPSTEALAAQPGIAAFLPVVAMEYLQMRFGLAFESADRPRVASFVQEMREWPSLVRTRPPVTEISGFKG